MLSASRERMLREEARPSSDRPVATSGQSIRFRRRAQGKRGINGLSTRRQIGTSVRYDAFG